MYNYKLKRLLLLLSFISIIVSIPYCRESIYDDDQKLSLYTVSQICNEIEKSSSPAKLAIRLVSNIPGYASQKAEDLKYDSDSDHFYNLKCSSDQSYSSGVLITVYYLAKKIRITVGDQTNTWLNHSRRLEIISRMGSFLKNEDYESAFRTAIQEVASTNQTSSSFFSNIVVIVAVILIFIVIIGACSSNHTQKVHNHFSQLDTLIKKEITTKSPPIASITDCTICMGKLSSPIIKFSCSHYFHEACIKDKPKLDYNCIMCDDPTSQVPTDFTEFSQLVNEKHILNVINNFDKIYDIDCLKSYYSSYSSDIKVIKDYNNIDSWVCNTIYLNPVTSTSYNSGYVSSSKRTHSSGGDYGDSSKTSTSGGDY